jgi:hypothetical protein
MASTSFVIADRKKQEKLVPVVTYVHGLSRPHAIAAWLSFLSVCHDDCHARVRLPGILSAEHEPHCLRLLDSIIESYVKVDSVPIPVMLDLCETSGKIIAGMSAEHAAFLKDRLSRICDDRVCQEYWGKFESASFLKDVSNLKESTLSALGLKKSSDFSSVIIALCVLYGCRDDFYERMTGLEETMKLKFGTGFPSDRLGLYLWPLDFSFAQEDSNAAGDKTEHLALLSAVQAINQDVRVQVCDDSLLWSRDKIAWISDEFDAFVGPPDDPDAGTGKRFGCGLVYEGGNIIPGTAVDRFVLAAQGPFSDSMEEVTFRYEMEMRNIKTYVLPDGFIWSRNPRSGQTIILDSIHIDAVINFIPSRCTVDAQPKLIIDPCYYALVRNSPDFKRFLDQQSIADADIVSVDERELYLNLPNFSIIDDQHGEKKLLFNKDKGHTLPRLNLKPGYLVQPDIEITAMASSFGSIRCATNMLPQSFVKEKSTPAFVPSKSLPAEAGKLLVELYNNNKPAFDSLSQLFVARIAIQPCQTADSWEYEEFSRTLSLYCPHDQASDPESLFHAVLKLVPSIAGALSQRLGIKIAVQV